MSAPYSVMCWILYFLAGLMVYDATDSRFWGTAVAVGLASLGLSIVRGAYIIAESMNKIREKM